MYFVEKMDEDKKLRQEKNKNFFISTVIPSTEIRNLLVGTKITI